jgi:gamma-glutamyltranspeptidase/glutathione hydrolase
MTGVGAVAAGNAHTAAAAAEVLRAGGNAVDAAVAAGFAASVAEPGLASLGGGGFLLSAPPDGPERLLDFFVDAPGRGRPAGAAAPLVPITVRFAGADQVFSAGWASVAVPGCLDGWVHASRTLGRLPLAQVVAPAARLARAGAVLDEAQAGLLVLLQDILLLTDDGRDAVRTAGGDCCAPASGLRNRFWPTSSTTSPAASVTGLRRWPTPCRRARTAPARCRGRGRGGVRRVEREPLRARYRGSEVVTNAPPSFGGALVLAALEELDQGDVAGRLARGGVRLADALTRMSERHVAVPQAVRGTTHVRRARPRRRPGGD